VRDLCSGRGKDPAQIQAYFNDEHAMTLGCATTTYPVSAMPSNPGAMYYPQLGDPSCNDTVGRPMRPTLYVTDITFDRTARPATSRQAARPMTRLRFSAPGSQPLATRPAPTRRR